MTKTFVTHAILRLALYTLPTNAVSSRGMPILAHNAKYCFKKQVIMLYGIYSIKNYYYSIINTIIIYGRNYILTVALRSRDENCESKPLAGESVQNVIRDGPLANL